MRLKRSIHIILGALIATAFACNRPIANFAYQGEMEAPAKVQFENLSEKSSTYVWDFGDGNTSTEAVPSHRYKSSGNYLVKLEAQNEKNKSKTIEKRLVIAPPKACLVEMETPYGNMLIKLYDSTPKHQENFVKLVEEGYYDSLLFHRVIRKFMIQGGDPESKNAKSSTQLGRGGPGYTVPAEFVDSLFHRKGALAAARQGDQVNPSRASSGSQFYIVQGGKPTESLLKQIEARNNIRYTKEQIEVYKTEGGTPQLDGAYTVFGQVLEGMAIIDSIASVKTARGDRPLEDVHMKIRMIK